MQIDHVALWTRDLERLREFYVTAMGGQSGPLYEKASTGFRSCFVSFDGGARLELMSRPGDEAEDPQPAERLLGWAHVALRLGSRDAVDGMVAQLEARGVPILGRPRVTGDGYYEAVVADPDGNRIELVE